MSPTGGYRTILRSTSIIGGASAISVLIGLVRMKVAAVLLGPTGIGLIGLLQSLMITAAAVASVGMGNAGTRQIAQAVARGTAHELKSTRKALVWGSTGLAIVGALLCVLLRDVLATRVLGDPARSNDVAWIGMGVALAVVAGAQTALLNGLRRIADLARISIGSALLSAILGIVVLLGWGEQGVLPFVLAGPLCTFILGCYFVARVESAPMPAPPLSQIAGQLKSMMRLGSAFMVGGLITNGGQLVARSLVQRELGTDAVGQFQAAWTISMTCIGFVLAAMGTDYFPRLTAVVNDRAAMNQLVNEQSELALLLSGPVLLLLLGLAPWLVELLYSRAFGEAAAILRWQILGDVLKVASWPLGFVILAAGSGRIFMLTESTAMAVYLAVVWFGLPHMGLAATGVAYLVMYCALCPLVYMIVARRSGFRWNAKIIGYLGALLVAAALIMLAEHHVRSSVTTMLMAVAAAGAFASFGALRIGANLAPQGRLGTIVDRLRRAVARRKADDSR